MKEREEDEAKERWNRRRGGGERREGRGGAEERSEREAVKGWGWV